MPMEITYTKDNLELHINTQYTSYMIRQHTPGPTQKRVPSLTKLCRESWKSVCKPSLSHQDGT